MSLKIILLFVFGLLASISAKSLTFVTDTTISMKDELPLMKRSFRSLLNDVRSIPIDTFISLPFGSTDHLESVTTWNIDMFSRSINRLQPWGGTEECPENSMAAIHKALELSDENSYIFVFTDAYARPYNVDGIKRICQAKHSRVVIFLTGYCVPTDKYPSGDVDVYSDVTSACSGAFFRIDSGDMQQAFNTIKEMMKSGWTDVSTEISSSGNIALKVPISSSTSDLVLAVSGDEPTLGLTRPDGSRAAVEKIVDTQYSAAINPSIITSQLLRVKDLQVGTYAVDIRSKGHISLTVFTRKDFPFSYGFSTRPPRSIRETSRRPMPGRDNILLIEIPLDAQIELNYAEILTEDGDRTILSLKKTSEEQKLYLSNSFKVNQAFKLSIYGRDSKTLKEFVETTTMLEPQSNNDLKPVSSRPSIEMLDKDSILVESSTSTTLACKVTSYPEPVITWFDDATMTYGAENVFLEIPSVYISYLTVTNVTRNNTYHCKAENRQGNSESSYQVFVKKNYYIEEKEIPYDQTIKYGAEGKLKCSVKAVPEASIKWYHNDSAIFFSDRLDVSSFDSSLTIKSMGLEDVGQYTCEASNAYEEKRFTAFVSISGLESPRIESSFDTTFVWNTGSSEELECRISRGTPSPQLTWQFKSDTNSEFGYVNSDLTSSGTKLIFKDVKPRDKGTYKCIATNVEGEDYKEFTVKIRLPPNIINDKEEFIEIKEKGTVELPCAVDADPNATIRWEYWKNGRQAADVTHLVDRSHTLRFKALQKDSGDYYCIARNDVGEDRRVVRINVLVSPYIKTPESRTQVANIGSVVVLPCRVLYGNPVPTTHWEYISETDGPMEILTRGSSSDLVLNSVTAEQAGKYTCLARNSVGVDSINIQLTVK